MSFFNDFSQTFSQISKSATGKVKDMSSVSKISKEIEESTNELNNLLNMLGRKYYEKFASSPDPEMADICLSISDLCGKINTLQAEADSIKSNAYCPACGEKVAPGDAFCANCGHKLIV